MDQKPLLVEKTWYLVSYNDTYSSPGVQEAYTLFNSNNTIIGYTGCKDLSGSYQTNFNQISITNINLGTGTCSDAALKQQEDNMLAILRSAQSYFVANTALQIAGDTGILNYSLTPMERPEEILPPQAVIRIVSQADVGQVVVFDGSGSTGQVPLVSWKWDFGDGQKASGETVQHVYSDPGAYTVQLMVTDQRNNKGSSSQQITILAQPTHTPEPTSPSQPTPTNAPPNEPTATPEPSPVPPQASASGPRDGFPGEPVTFDASRTKPGSSEIVSYSWSFGDGTSQGASPDAEVSAIYKTTGDFEVSVTVVDANGLSSVATTHITIDARLDTDVWTLSEINEEPLLEGTAITLQFLEGELVGFAGCNTYQGEYTAIDNGDNTYTITITKIKTTRRLCPNDIMDQEKEYLTILEQATDVIIEENMITMNAPENEMIFFLVEPEE
jgi:heat shock protein HslJ